MHNVSRCFSKHLKGFNLLAIYFQNKRTMSSLEKLTFDNKALSTLPVDKTKVNDSRTVKGACFSLVDPTNVDSPKVVAFSQSALDLLDIENKDVDTESFAEYFSGNKKFDGSVTAAHCYCGHQFGYFSGQLGDGAAIYLGEIINKKGERWELQLKGAGPTPFSRRSDGRKVLRSSIREFLCSEAMHHLGIPTTRAGSCVTSDSLVVRDIFYDGNPKMEKCTIVSRIAPTFIRFGSFEIFKPLDRQTGRSGPSVGRTDILFFMLDYVISTFYPEIFGKYEDNKELCYLEFYKEVVKRTAILVSHWQCVGFCHGVLNTDNMSIMGLTIDYGPFGFMDYFDPDHICNASDNNGRYSYKKQPEICKWNLLKLAEAIKEAVPLEKTKEILNDVYDKTFEESYYNKMLTKLGLTQHFDVDNDKDLVQKLLYTMQKTSADFTNTFRLLADMPVDSNATCDDVLSTLLEQCESVEGLKKRYSDKVDIQQLMMLLSIAESSPEFLSRFGLSLEQLKSLIDQSQKDQEITKLTPEEKKSRDKKLWGDWIKLYRERIVKETTGIADDKEKLSEFEKERRLSMNSVNPRFILRNYMAQEVIDAAEKGDFSKVQNLVTLLEKPYSSDDVEFIQQFKMPENDEATPSNSQRTVNNICRYDSSAPSWAADLRVT